MVSVNTNAAAITALRTLQSTNASMDKTQAHISTGLKIGEAKDNAAYWAISTTLKSDNKSLATVKDALGLGASTVDVAYQGLNKAKDVLDEIKSKLTAATQDGVNRDTIQNEIKQLQDQLKSIATSSIFSGENWLSTDSSAVSYNANKQVVASFARDASGSVSIGTIGVDIGNVALFDASTVAGKDAILDSKQLLKGRDGSVLAVGGVADTAGNTVTAGLATAAGTHAVVVGAVGSNNTAVGTGAAAGGVAAAGVAGNAGIASTRTEAAGFAAITGTTDSGTPATDTLDITMEIDGVSKVVHVSNAAGVDSITLNDIVNAINAPVGANSFGPGVASIDPANGGSLKLTGGTTAATLNTRITALGVTGATGVPSYTGLTTAGPTTGTPATSGALTRAIGALTGGLNTGDTVEVSYTLGNGTSATATMTLGSNVTTAAQFATAWASATNTNGITVTNPAGSNLTFTDSATRGTTSNVTINDVVVKAASTGQIKNVDVIGGGFTESAATSVRTGALTWTDLGATDKVTLGLTKGGAALTPVTVNAGASLSDFVNNLNANGTFSADFRASVVSTNQLLITNVSTGTTTGAFGLTSVAFATSAGVPKTVATTGFGQLTSAPTATTGAFAQFTLDVNDTMDFSVQIGTGAAKNVSIDQALVNTTLGSAAGGKVDTVANFKRVLDAALTKAGVTGVTTTANTGDLTFVGTLGQSLVITGGTASQGAQTMSVDQLDISNAKLASLGATTSSQIKDVLSAYIDVVNNAINKVTSAAASLGSVASRIDLQKTFVDTLMDTIDKGVGNLIDADMSEESTKLQALQVKQQLGVQSLSIANQSAQNILSLFRS